MKSIKFLLGAFCAIGMIACSNSDDVDDGGGTTPDGTSQNLYLSVNVMAANEGTRATYMNGDPNDAQYEKGEGDENKVENAVFYFFYEDGSPANVVKNANAADGYVNYYESPIVDGSTDDMPNVEKILTSTVVINTKRGDRVPDKIVAILNLNVNDYKSQSINDLSKIVKDFRLNETTTSFVMSSSVYSDGGVKMMAVDNIKDYFDTNQAVAEANPVDIYVERVLAKVSVGTKMTANPDNLEKDNETLYYTGQTIDKSDDVNQRVYVKFLGWNIATETESSYLFKNINPAWTKDDLGITSWTWPDFHRSFWAMNPNGVEYDNYSFDKATLKIGSVDANGNVVYGTKTDTEDNRNYTYVQENASPYKEDGTATALKENATKVLVAAQLVDKNGAVINLAEWRGLRSNEAGVLKNMANFSGIYYQDPEDVTKRHKITPEMIEFTDGDKYAYAVLTETAKTNTFYLSSTATEATTPDLVNASLKDKLGEAKVWKGGNTYYYTDIRHLGKITPAAGDTPEDVSVGAYGVVRNHSYQVVINSVTGLGTPVYKPGDVIIPDTPDEEESYLAARIKVLSWRVVKSTVDLK